MTEVHPLLGAPIIHSTITRKGGLHERIAYSKRGRHRA